MAETSKRRVMRGPHQRKDTRWNSDKEQLHLTPGSAEYEEYVRDHKDIDEEDYVMDDRHLDMPNDSRMPDKDPDPQPAYIREYAPGLREATENQMAASGAVNTQRYTRYMQKAAITNRMLTDLEKAAARTPGKDDDAMVHSMERLEIDDMPGMHDYGATASDYARNIVTPVVNASKQQAEPKKSGYVRTTDDMPEVKSKEELEKEQGGSILEMRGRYF